MGRKSKFIYLLRNILGHSASDSTIQKVTHSVGKKLFEENIKNAQEAFDNMIDIPYTHSKAGVLYIMIDGAAINTRKHFEVGTSWRENKLIMVFNSNDLKLRSDGITMDILHKEYVSYIGNAVYPNA
ncbi:MAG: hypothetical protein Ta2B_09180 [Termitinemataceae bacterium]|nr:MAG: hypothetical protein Ta2B_09180 [Termitinemataceae bacterium]